MQTKVLTSIAFLLPALMTPPLSSTAGAADNAKGKTLFESNCSVCHQTTGKGMPNVFPPLVKNPVVNDDDSTTQLHTILFGAQGTKIMGVTYATPMPPLGQTLKDEDVAAIANYERSAWGNHGKPVTVEQVKAVRAKGK